MVGLRIRMFLLTAFMFAMIYAVIVVIGSRLGINNFYFYLIFALVIMSIQYMLGPKIVDWSMRVRYIKPGEYPQLEGMVRNLSAAAKIPMPRIGIAQVAIPNAFAYGRTVRDARVCVTEGILKLLDDKEMRAVLGHEMSHIKNRDVLTITLLSVIPMILYRIAWQFLFFGGGRRDRGQNGAIVGLVAFGFYFVTNLLVLYASRIREYFADKGSIDLGNDPSSLASALYKLVYGSARADRAALKDVEGMKAFFANDPSRAAAELKDLRDLDLDKSGTISRDELMRLQARQIKLGFGDKMMELLSTHPNMLKRIKRLSEWSPSQMARKAN
jgi:heat shock protein HtpX